MVTQDITRPEAGWAGASLVKHSKAKSIFDNQYKLCRSQMKTKGSQWSHYQPVASMRERNRGQSGTLSHFTFLKLLE